MGHLIGQYEVRDSETGNFIDCFAFVSDAELEIKRMENVDKKEGCFTVGFYEIYDTLKGEIL